MLLSSAACAQTTLILQNPSDAPVNKNPWTQAQAQSPTLPNAPVPSVPQQRSATVLSLKDAETLAIKNNPQISVSRLNALASEQVTREVRSSLWPQARIDITGVDAAENSRIAAGGLNNPIIYERAAAGTTVSQLITDFGHTSNLVASARLSAKAEDQNALATKEQVLVAVAEAFYNALQNRAILKVAQQTVDSRQIVVDQVGALTRSKLKSDLDLSFANVNLAQAQLLLLDAQNNDQAAIAALSAILGYTTLQNFQLAEDTEPLIPPAADVNQLIGLAFNQRPELLALQFQSQSDEKLRRAQRDELFPTISALGAVGDTPVRNDHLSSWYGAVGVNVAIPVFNGFLFNAREREASLRQQATDERLRDIRDRIARDVRTSWLEAATAYQRVSVSQQLLNQSNQALDLASTRYKLGLGSIVELSQAQLQQTQAQISNAQAAYGYRLASSVLLYQTTGL
jgi:outer membrane protein